VGPTPPSEIEQVLATSAAVAIAASPSSLGGAGPLPKKARTKNYLPPIVRYVHEGCCMILV
jgi:hypothetical protein